MASESLMLAYDVFEYFRLYLEDFVYELECFDFTVLKRQFIINITSFVPFFWNGLFEIKRLTDEELGNVLRIYHFCVILTRFLFFNAIFSSNSVQWNIS